MFEYISQDVFRRVAFCRAKLIETQKTELAFVKKQTGSQLEQTGC